MSETNSNLTAILEDRKLMALFERAARKNGRSAEEVLGTFIRDYIVSGGHPEQVGDCGQTDRGGC